MEQLMGINGTECSLKQQRSCNLNFASRFFEH